MGDTRKKVDELVAGDDVLVMGNNTIHLSKVVKVTSKFIMVGSEQHSTRYRRRDGTSTGNDTWHHVHIVHATAEDIAKMQRMKEKQKLCARLRGVNWSVHPIETLTKVIELLEGEKQDDPNS